MAGVCGVCEQPPSPGPLVLTNFCEKIDRALLPGKLIVPIIQLPAIMKIGVIVGVSEKRLEGGFNLGMRQIS